jgi:hypothetical protein
MIVKSPNGSTLRVSGAGVGREELWLAVPVVLTRAGYRPVSGARAHLVRRAGCTIVARR